MLTRGLVTATISAAMLLAPTLTEVSYAAQLSRGGGAMSPGGFGPARGAMMPPAMPLRMAPERSDTSRTMAPPVRTVAGPVSPGVLRPTPRVVTPSVTPAPMARERMEPMAPPAMNRTVPQPRMRQAQPEAVIAPRTRPEPRVTTAQPRAEVGRVVAPRTPSLIPAQPSRQVAQAGPIVAPRMLREPGGTQAPARPVLQPRVPDRVERTTSPQMLQSWLRTQNAGARTLRPDRDVLGNQIPRDAVVVSPDRLTRMNRDFGAVRERFGDPAHRVAFIPRTGFDRDFFGIHDGHDGFHRHRHHSIVVINFFYPFYFSDPFWFGFGYPGYYPSVYSFWGWTPAWVYPDRVVYSPPSYVYGTANPYYLYGGSSVDSVGAQAAIEDIRQAWITGDAQLIAQYLTDQQEVAVYFSGDYTYSTSSQDYYGMTVDAISTTQTVALDFDDPVWVSQNEVFYTGRHTFTDPDGSQRTVYVSYLLKKIGGAWYIESVGSSPQPIQSQYRDFRSY